MHERRTARNQGIGRRRGGWLTRVLLPAALLACCPGLSLAADQPLAPADGGVLDLAIYRDPAIASPESRTTFDPRLRPLWTTALRRPDAELRRQALHAFGAAKAQGMTGIEDLVPTLTEVLIKDGDLEVRLAAATALTQFDDPAAAEAVLEVSTRGDTPGIETIVDPALARWKHQPAVAVWEARIADAAMPLQVRLSAARALGTIGATGSIETLTAAATHGQAPASLRLAAAEALATLAKDGLVPAATELEGGDTIGRLVAARMLAGHTSREARLLLDAMIVEEGQDPAVVAEAARSLLAIDPAEVAKRAETLVKHADPGARLALAQALLQLPEDDRQPHILAAMLDDASVDVRHTAREGILAAAAAGQDVAPVVATTLAGGGQVPVEAGSVGIGTIGWRGLEQAALIAGRLDHEATADRLIELLRHDRAEVRVAAAQALRQLAVSATLPAMLERAQQLAEPLPADAPVPVLEAAGEESTQLFMAFGEMNHREADALARKYIPKGSGYYPVARGAAVYALGKFHEGALDEQLAAQLASRLSDTDPMNPEMTEVRRFAAIALGRMKAEAQLGTLRRFYNEENASPDIGGACRWAIMQITGEELPPLETVVSRQGGWFLQPAK